MVWKPPIRSDSVVITAPLLNQISKIDEFKGAWLAIGRITPERLLSLRHIATVESIGSSTRIEGAKLTDREVEALLNGLDTQSFASRDEEEVAGYADAMRTVIENWQDIPLTENHIKQLHGTVLGYSSKDQRHRGDYKTQSNHVEAFASDGKRLGTIFETATPFNTPALMQALIEWTQTELAEDDGLHSLITIGLFVVVFLAIHPFQDGNGRLSRVLTNLLLLRSGYAYVPYSSLENVIEHNKEAYYLALRGTQITLKQDVPDWGPWLQFFLQSLERQKNRLEQKIETERLVSGDLPELSLKILQLCRERGRVSVAEVQRATNANRNTIKDHLKALVKAAHLVRHGAGRGAWYGLE